MHKHFRMVALSQHLRNNGYTSPADDHTRIPGVWEKLRSLYNLESLDERVSIDVTLRLQNAHLSRRRIRSATMAQTTLARLESPSLSSGYHKQISETPCLADASHQTAQRHLPGFNTTSQKRVQKIDAEAALWKRRKVRSSSFHHCNKADTGC